jgi:hypothetical protein
MPALVAGIHVLTALRLAKTWMAGTSPAMTVKSVSLSQNRTRLVSTQHRTRVAHRADMERPSGSRIVSSRSIDSGGTNMNRLTGIFCTSCALGAIALGALTSVPAAQAADYYDYEERGAYDYRAPVYPRERYVERYDYRPPAHVYADEEPIEYRVVIYPVKRRHPVHAYPAPDYAPRAHYGAPVYRPAPRVVLETDVLLPPAPIGPRW